MNIFYILVGDCESFSFENRMFNAVMLLLSLTGLIAFSYDVFLSNNVSKSIDLVCFGYSLSCYVYSKSKKRFAALITPSLFIFFISLLLGLFVNNGMHGSLPYFFFLMVSYCVIFIEKPFKYAIPSILITLALTAFIEFHKEEYFFHYTSKVQDFLDITITSIMCLTVNGFIIYFIFNEYKNERKINKKMLDQALIDRKMIEESVNELKILKGLLPICANCKKIRDSEGSWKQLEEYIHNNSEAKFSHGICPECAKSLYSPYLHTQNISRQKNITI